MLKKGKVVPVEDLKIQRASRSIAARNMGNFTHLSPYSQEKKPHYA